MSKPPPTRFLLELTAIPWRNDDREPVHRLRALLKAILRGYGFRVTQAREIKQKTQNEIFVSDDERTKSCD